METRTALPQPRSPRYECLDMWRGVACLGIIVYHVGLYTVRKEAVAAPGGSWLKNPALALLAHLWLAVPIFFVISGYCIAATTDATRRKPRAPLLYFGRRIRRIFPPYWVVFLLTLMVCWACTRLGWAHLLSNQDEVLVNPEGFGPAEWAGNLTLTETWRHHVIGEKGCLLVGQAWSLCYEEQFYLVCGVLLFLMPRFFFTGIGGITLLSIGVALLRVFGMVSSLEGFFFDGNWLLFALGVLVYYTLNYLNHRQRFGVILLLAVGIGAAFTHRYWVWLKALAPAFLASCLFAQLIILLHPYDRHLARSRFLSPLFFCGRMCYSMYLVHILVAHPLSHGFHQVGLGGFWITLVVTIPIGVCLSVIMAWIFYMLVERRFLNSSAGSLVGVRLRSVGEPGGNLVKAPAVMH